MNRFAVFTFCAACGKARLVYVDDGDIDELIELGAATRNELHRRGWVGADDALVCPACSKETGEDDE